MKILTLFFMVSLAMLTADRVGAEEFDCAFCHQNPAMKPSLKNKFGVAESLYIDPEAFRESWHYKVGELTSCDKCHPEIKSYPHTDYKPPNCVKCHDNAESTLIQQRISESIHKDIDCNECHNAHSNRPAKEMTLEKKNAGCRKCHEYGMPNAEAFVQPIPIEEFHDWHPQAKLHLALMACIVCHTDIREGRNADKHLILDKSHATRECSTCHSGDSKITEYLIDIGPEAGTKNAPEEVLKRIYLIGGTRNKWIELPGMALLLLTILGVVGHGLGRIVFGGRS